jgi:nitroreductase
VSSWAAKLAAGAGRISVTAVNDVITLLQAHRSIRRFTDEPVDDATVAELVRCGTAAATSSNVQATTVVRVRNEQTRRRIAELAGGQRHVVDSPVFLVFCADLKRPGTASRMHGVEPTPGMTEQFVIATVDVALAAQNVVVAAESLGLGVCYIGAVRNDPQTVSDLLELPRHVYPVFGLCLGRPAQDPEVKPRLPLEAVLKEEVYRDDRDEELIAAYDETMRRYYGSRSGGNKDSCWTAEMAQLVGTERRPHLRAFLAERGFELR